jgi:cytochrome c biogenesis factor
MAELGRAALVVSLGLALYALVAGTTAALQNRRRLADSARNALIACFGSTVVASAVLAEALVRHDFTFTYVYSHTSRTLPSGAGRRARSCCGCWSSPATARSRSPSTAGCSAT